MLTKPVSFTDAKTNANVSKSVFVDTKTQPILSMPVFADAKLSNTFGAGFLLTPRL
jgi:hypothetical protein